MSLPKTPALVTDCVVFDPQGRVLLVQRGSEPYKGLYALLDIGERSKTPVVERHMKKRGS
jgi:8-oxo-dGTP diphosphatase